MKIKDLTELGLRGILFNDYDTLKRVADDIEYKYDKTWSTPELRLGVAFLLSSHLDFMVHDKTVFTCIEGSFLYLLGKEKAYKFDFGSKIAVVLYSYFCKDYEIQDISLRLDMSEIDLTKDSGDRNMMVDVKRGFILDTRTNKITYGIECTYAEVSMLKRKLLLD